MGFLARLSARARPHLSRTPAALPKGVAARSAVPVFREAAPEDEEEEVMAKRAAPPLRRQEEPPEDEEEMQRAPAEEEPDEEMQRSPLRRAEEPEEEEEIAPLRRAEDADQGEEEEIAPIRRLRRQAEEEEEPEEIQAARPIRRAEEVPLEEGEKPLRQPFESDLVPGATPPHPDLANEEEPSSLQALRREPAAPDAPPHTPAESRRGETTLPPAPALEGTIETATPDSLWNPEADFGRDFPETAFPAPSGARSADRPQVIIDQLDVLIHEPAPPPAPGRRAVDTGRALRARYLRRL